LKLSDVQLWPLESFKPHPSNHIFEESKTKTYWRDLRRDIVETGAILNPLIALPDGTLLEGHSRLRIAGELKAEGNDLGKIPVRVVSSPITAEEVERRVYLGNLSRFELDENTRLSLYARIWPDFYGQEGKAGRRTKKGDTMSPLPPTAQEIAEVTRKSPRQVKRDRKTVIRAGKIAAQKGKSAPDTEDIQEARKEGTSKRKAPAKAAAGRVTIQLSRGHAETVLRILRRVKPPNTPAAAIHEIEKALRGNQ